MTRCYLYLLKTPSPLPHFRFGECLHIPKRVTPGPQIVPNALTKTVGRAQNLRLSDYLGPRRDAKNGPRLTPTSKQRTRPNRVARKPLESLHI
jgi:hypothetical protein